MRVLYVEDNPEDIESTRRVLKEATLTAVGSVTEAVQVLAHDPTAFDVVLADVRLPDGSGLGVLTHIRAQHWPLAVIMVTGLGDDQTVMAALKAGATDYIVKRVGYLQDLPRLVSAALTRQKVMTSRYETTLTVVYAEYDPGMVQSTLHYLNRYAPHIHLQAVSSANALRQRLALPTETRPHAILINSRLPDLDVLEFVRTQALDSAPVPLVLLALPGDEELAVQALKLGAADYLTQSAGYLGRLSLVLENAVQRAQLTQDQKELTTVYRASARLLQPGDSVAQVVNRINQTVLAEFDLHHVAVMALTPDGKTLTHLPSDDLPLPDLLMDLPLAGPGLIPLAVRTGQAVYAPDVLQHPDYVAGLRTTRTELVLPLKVGDQLIGALNFESPTVDAFDQRTRRMLTLFAEQAALVLKNAQLLEQAKMLMLAAQSAERLKTEFLANTSHELRTPLTTIIGSLGLVLDGASVSREEEHAWIRTALQACHKLNSFVTDLLDIARLEAGQFQLDMQPVSVPWLLAEVAGLHRHAAAQKGLDLQVQCPASLPPIWADHDRVRQILVQLVHNAIKFTARGQVVLRAEEDVVQACVFIDVCDTGVGIPQESRPFLFKPFVQGDGSTTRRYGGTGLGLNLAYRLSQAMSGSLDLLQTSDLQGSVFRLTLPIAPPVQPSTSTEIER